MTTTGISQQALPVSVELLQCLEQVNQHAQVIFDDLSKPGGSGGQQQQQQQQSRADHAIPYARALASLTALSNTDEKLADLLNKAEIHARNQKRIEQLEDKLVRHEVEWRREVNHLESDRKKLKSIIDRGKKDKEAIEQAKKGVCIS